MSVLKPGEKEWPHDTEIMCLECCRPRLQNNLGGGYCSDANELFLCSDCVTGDLHKIGFVIGDAIMAIPTRQLYVGRGYLNKIIDMVVDKLRISITMAIIHQLELENREFNRINKELERDIIEELSKSQQTPES